jgi:cellulose synthase/poly-beta-1,6-N-acetylglucosamine synthase-like glycosyltransferase
VNHTKKTLAVSIVIPCYDEESIIKECLDSIEGQTLTPEEVIIVDNNCHDNTVQIAERYPFVRVIREARQGISYARTKGLDAAKSDIIARIDADTVLPRDWVQKTVAAFDSSGAAALTGSVYIRNKPLQKITSFFFTLVYYRLSYLVSRTYILNGCNMAIRRDAWQHVHNAHWLRDDEYHEDADLSLRLRKKGYRVSYMNNTVSILARTGGNYSDNLEYLQKWGRTYRKHGYVSWVFYAVLARPIAFGDTLSRVMYEATRALYREFID